MRIQPPTVRSCVFSVRRRDTRLRSSGRGASLRPDNARHAGDRRSQSADPELTKPPPDYDAEERDYLIRTIAFEASGEPEEGKSAVAHVILNRTAERKMGRQYQGGGDPSLAVRAVDDAAEGDAKTVSERSSLSERSSHCRCRSCRRDARPHRGRDALPQSDDRSAAPGRLTAGMGAWRRAPDRQAYLLFAR